MLFHVDISLQGCVSRPFPAACTRRSEAGDFCFETPGRNHGRGWELKQSRASPPAPRPGLTYGALCGQRASPALWIGSYIGDSCFQSLPNSRVVRIQSLGRSWFVPPQFCLARLRSSPRFCLSKILASGRGCESELLSAGKNNPCSCVSPLHSPPPP